MSKFRKKPVVIEATQFLGPGKQGGPGQEPFPAGVSVYQVHDSWGASIQTLEGKMFVSVGDWIITGVKGEKYPCKPDIFEATYEPVED